MNTAKQNIIENLEQGAHVVFFSFRIKNYLKNSDNIYTDRSTNSGLGSLILVSIFGDKFLRSLYTQPTTIDINDNTPSGIPIYIPSSDDVVESLR